MVEYFNFYKTFPVTCFNTGKTFPLKNIIGVTFASHTEQVWEECSGPDMGVSLVGINHSASPLLVP